MTRLLVGAVLMWGTLSWAAAGPFPAGTVVQCLNENKEVAFTVRIVDSKRIDATIAYPGTMAKAKMQFVETKTGWMETQATYNISFGGQVILSQSVTMSHGGRGGAFGCGRAGCQEKIFWSAQLIDAQGVESVHSCIQL